MNSIKPLITIAVLGGIGYVVYNQLNSKPPTPPPGAPQGWESGATVQMPGEGGSDTKWGGLGGSPNSVLPPAAIGAASATRAESAAPTFSGSQAGGVAPTFGTNNSTPGDEKWGTTDPAAAVPSGTPPATASYGDPSPAAGSPPADPYSAAPTGAVPSIAGPADVNSAAGQPDVVKQFAAAWENGNRMLEEGKLTEGLLELSQWYDHPQLSAIENRQLTDLLDQVAGTVIYSIQHHLAPAHVVKEGERMEDIAAQYNVPAQLIAKINGIEAPSSLQPGEQLKVIRGPFSAAISLNQRQLTLMLNGMYAGRFLVGIGRDMPPREGTFAVTEKVIDPVYHGRERTIEANDPGNPLGERWIALGSDMGLHGTGPLTDIGSTNQPGSISMGQRDIEDVFDILSVGSKVIITK